MVIAHEGEKPVAAACTSLMTIRCMVATGAALRNLISCTSRPATTVASNIVLSAVSPLRSGRKGEHKIQRGFEPTLTYSNHWVAEPRLKDAVADFCRRDCDHVRRYRDGLRRYYPLNRNRNARYRRLRWRLVTQKDPLRSFRMFLAKVVPGSIKGLERLRISNSLSMM